MLRILPVMREADATQRELERMVSQRRDFIRRPEGPPSGALLRAAESEREEIERIFSRVESELDIETPRLLPEEITRPSIYWLDTLRRKRAEISSRAREKRVAIPSGLGFADTLPSDERVPELLFRLYVAEELIDKAIENALRSISEIAFGETSDAEGLSGLDVKKASLTFSVQGSLENLFRFIKSLRSASFVYTVSDIGFEAVEVERTVAVETPDAPVRRRQDARRPSEFPDEMFPDEMRETQERRIVERFLNANLRVDMYYIPGREEVEITSPEAGDGIRERPPEFPEAPPVEPSERRRIVR